MIQLNEPISIMRKKMISDAKQKIDLDIAYASNKKIQRLKGMLQTAIGETAFQDRVETIIDILLSDSGNDSFLLYNRCRHEFGNENGRKIYKAIKGILVTEGDAKDEKKQ